MILEPVVTEKSTNLAKEGKYTFRVDMRLTKNDVKALVSKVFGVKVLSVKTLKEHGEIKKGMSGRKKVIKPTKKAIVTLSGKEKISLFETKKK